MLLLNVIGNGYKSKLIVLFLVCLFASVFSPELSSSAIVEGIVLSEKGPVADSRVYAYDTFKDMVNGEPSFVSVKGDKAGFFKLELPPGRYYFISKGNSAGRQYFSYHGANPIIVEDRNLWIPFMALPQKKGFIKDSSSTRLSGNVTFKQKPVQNAQVSIYPLSDISFRGMGFLTSTTDYNGFFSLRPEPDTYVIVARKRKNFMGLRPLKKGDLFCYFASNPVRVKASSETYIEIPCYPKDDLKTFLNEDVYPSILVKKSGEDSIRFRESKIEKPASILEIKGRVTDLHANPMKNMYVKAYQGKSTQMFKMLYIRTMPEYMVKTDEQGYYLMNVEEKGTYYIVARELIGQAPEKDEYYGLYEDNANHAVELAEESVDGVDIVVSRVMAEVGKMQGVRGDKLVIGNYEYSENTVINEDTVWNG
jgi:hypothetical protein